MRWLRLAGCGWVVDVGDAIGRVVLVAGVAAALGAAHRVLTVGTRRVAHHDPVDHPEWLGAGFSTWEGDEAERVARLMGLQDIDVSRAAPLGITTAWAEINFRYEGAIFTRHFELFADTLLRDVEQPTFYYTAASGLFDLLPALRPTLVE